MTSTSIGMRLITLLLGFIGDKVLRSSLDLSRMASRNRQRVMKRLAGLHHTKDGQKDGTDKHVDGIVLTQGEVVNFWTWLPDHIIRNVLVRLPVPKLFQLRSVCKQWKQLIDSPDSPRVRAEIPSSETTNFLLLQMNSSLLTTADDWTALDNNEFALHTLNIHSLGMYNPFLRTWYNLPPSILTQSEIFCRSYHRGVWCIQLLSRKRKRLEEDEFRILVHNPTSGWTREVPTPSDGPKLKVLLSLVITDIETSTNEFKLISTGCADGELSCSCTPADCIHTQVYDSASRRWTAAGNLPSSVLFFKTNGRSNVMNIVTGRHVYYMVSRRLSTNSRISRAPQVDESSSGDQKRYTWTLLSFDLEDSTWRMVDGNVPFTNVMHFRTIVSEGSRCEGIVVAQLTSTSEYEWRASLGWKLRVYSWDRQRYPEVLTWTEIPVTAPPEEQGLPKLFYQHRSHRFAGSWAAQGDWIIFVLLGT